ncbi:L-alanine-DL-glutamate epimerase-like enolase superfamily enzyme [Paraburkholderia unamae]|uniref:enolase C-terminal domain-like protein n=1 Tax=Paraburkholderia unamae TaxID=219649 RepID=UPI000DC2B6C3|nr:enolase C-terminal domain-like protein [Paraburkholderia unamae]RAR49327.1 L-alanine-DL-glutamate epimerase-like enolase superfamily enzyme [Paraburkholderia unamae]
MGGGVNASRVTRLEARAFAIPTDSPEADGTIAWRSTTLVLCEIDAIGFTGIGYTYAHASAASLIGTVLADAVHRYDVFDIARINLQMQREVRNIGRRGLAACAISAVDSALWDLKAKALGLPLCVLLGMQRESVPVYGSGGFTTYDIDTLQRQLGGWVNDDGCEWVKMKVGSSPRNDPARVEAARQAIGSAGLFVDANGAYEFKEAQRLAEYFATQGVQWFEEPVSSDDHSGLAALRAGLPPGMALAAGEYGYTADDFRALLDMRAVDVLQVDATRCCGISGFLQADALCDAWHAPLSAHCAPALHLHVACAARRLQHIEWFHDHARIEGMLFDGAPQLRGGQIAPDLTRLGNGLAFRHADGQRFALN